MTNRKTRIASLQFSIWVKSWHGLIKKQWIFFYSFPLLDNNFIAEWGEKYPFFHVKYSTSFLCLPSLLAVDWESLINVLSILYLWQRSCKKLYYWIILWGNLRFCGLNFFSWPCRNTCVTNLLFCLGWVFIVHLHFYFTLSSYSGLLFLQEVIIKLKSCFFEFHDQQWDK